MGCPRFWGGTGILCYIWCFFRMPETGGFSFAELDILFANKIPARKFTSVALDEQRELHDGSHGMGEKIPKEQKDQSGAEHIDDV